MLVELLAAIPSVVLGLWGILVLGPFVAHTLGPFLETLLGWTPFFEGTPQVSSYLSAVIVPQHHDHPDRVEHQPRAVSPGAHVT